MQKIYSIITQFNPYHQDDLWALVVYRTPGESTTRYLVQVEKQLKMVHHYIFFLTHQIQMFYFICYGFWKNSCLKLCFFS